MIILNCVDALKGLPFPIMLLLIGTNIPINIDIYKRFSIYFQLFTIFGYKTLKNSEKLIKNKLGPLIFKRRNRKTRRGNLSPACKYLGYSWDTFYRYKVVVETGGELTLREQRLPREELYLSLWLLKRPKRKRLLRVK